MSKTLPDPEVTQSSHALVVGAIAIAAFALLAWVLFAGAYLPYTDWAKHAALVEILAHGPQTGADAYWERTLRPTPYWTFYATVAAVVQLTGLDADFAGRWVLAGAAALVVLAHAHLLRACRRDVRFCVLAPLALMGLPLGYGFGSFLCATPAALFAWARTEVLLQDARWRNVVLLAAAYVLVLLGHGLWALAVMLAVFVRVVVFVVVLRRRLGVLPWVTLLRGALSLLPAAVLGGAMVARPVPPVEHIPVFWEHAPLAERLDWMKRALVGQFVAPREAAVFALALALCGLWSVVLVRRGSSLRSSPSSSSFAGGLETYAFVLLFLALLGPKSLGGPVQVYLIFPRFLGAALALVLCVPRVVLRTRAAWALWTWTSAVPVFAATAQHAVVAHASRIAADFDGVRALVPQHALVLALWAPDAQDPLRAFPGFWPGFWLGIDGAAFSTGLFNYEAHPVFRKKSSWAPAEVRALAFRPDVHGRGWEYVVVRGRVLAERLDASSQFVLVGSSGRYRVYRNQTVAPRAPPPRR
jgi:hypothetical protein